MIRASKNSVREDTKVEPHAVRETVSYVKFEIGHVLFIDILGYSKLLINEQSDQLQTLKQIVRGTEQFRLSADRSRRQVVAFTHRRWWRIGFPHKS